MKAVLESAVEITFTPTRDGLVVSRVTLRPADSAAEADLRRFLDRFRDPALDLKAWATTEGVRP